MKRATIILTVITVFSANILPAQNLQLTSVPTVTDNGTTLSICGSATGMEINQWALIRIYTTAIITSCTNSFGKVVSIEPKPIAFVGKFKSDGYGGINFCITAPSQFSEFCVNGNWLNDAPNISLTNTTIMINGDRAVSPSNSELLITADLVNQ